MVTALVIALVVALFIIASKVFVDGAAECLDELDKEGRKEDKDGN